MGKIKLIILTLVIGGLSKFLYDIFSDGDLQKSPVVLVENWGDPKNFKEDTKIYPFKINVEEKILQDLKTRLADELADQRYTPPLNGIGGFEYGFNSKYLQKILNYWNTKYDWRAREKLLNAYPNFKTKINGLSIHFQHVKSQNSAGKYKKTLPLMLLHGWPGSIVELQKIIPMLTDPKDSNINFELIIPSLPGYGWSDPATRPGLGPVKMAPIFLQLMQRLGFQKFYLHGGDWGGVIVAHMGTLYPENVKAVHTNLCLSFHPRANLRHFFATWFPSLVMSGAEQSRFSNVSRLATFWIRETGYLHIQATKPDTIGIGLSNSPSGLAAYIIEKFSTWTNEKGLGSFDGDLEKAFTMDELLDNVMVYWVTNSITTSMRLYSEYFNVQQFGLYNVLDRMPMNVPTGCIVANNDGYFGQSQWVVQDKFPNVIQYTLTPQGGHFLALEHPQVMADDIVKFFRLLEKNKNL